MIIVNIILFTIGAYFLFYSFFWLSSTVLSLRKKTIDSGTLNEENPEILLLLPAYQPGPVFFQVMDAVENAIKGRDIKVYALLQEAAPGYAEYAKSKGFYIEEKAFGHLGGNSYQHALRHLCEVILNEQRKGKWNPEFVMLLDKDNLISDEFFSRIPGTVYDKSDIIQGKRGSLNINNAIAFFDNMTEALNDAMFRTAKERVGSMIEISGSGALIETDLFIDAIRHLDPKAPGFDKNFMIQLLTSYREIRTTFWPASELKEEKTSHLEAHNPQRVRWFGEQYYNALFHARTLIKAFRVYRRFAALDYLVTLWRPPRSVQFFVVPCLAVAELAWFVSAGSWIAVFPLFTLSAVILMLAVVTFLLSEGIFLQSMRYGLKLPRLAFHNFFNALRSIRKENRGTFIHTTHRM